MFILMTKLTMIKSDLYKVDLIRLFYTLKKRRLIFDCTVCLQFVLKCQNSTIWIPHNENSKYLFNDKNGDFNCNFSFKLRLYNEKVNITTMNMILHKRHKVWILILVSVIQTLNCCLKVVSKSIYSHLSLKHVYKVGKLAQTVNVLWLTEILL